MTQVPTFKWVVAGPGKVIGKTFFPYGAALQLSQHFKVPIDSFGVVEVDGSFKMVGKSYSGAYVAPAEREGRFAANGRISRGTSS